MGYKKNDPCIAKAYDDERLFVLMTRDVQAPATVLFWIAQSVHSQPEEKLREAFECAMQMKRENTEFMSRSFQDKQVKEK